MRAVGRASAWLGCTTRSAAASRPATSSRNPAKTTRPPRPSAATRARRRASSGPLPARTKRTGTSPSRAAAASRSSWPLPSRKMATVAASRRARRARRTRPAAPPDAPPAPGAGRRDAVGDGHHRGRVHPEGPQVPAAQGVGHGDGAGRPAAAGPGPQVPLESGHQADLVLHQVQGGDHRHPEAGGGVGRHQVGVLEVGVEQVGRVVPQQAHRPAQAPRVPAGRQVERVHPHPQVAQHLRVAVAAQGHQRQHAHLDARRPRHPRQVDQDVLRPARPQFVDEMADPHRLRRSLRGSLPRASAGPAPP